MVILQVDSLTSLCLPFRLSNSHFKGLVGSEEILSLNSWKVKNITNLNYICSLFQVLAAISRTMVFPFSKDWIQLGFLPLTMRPEFIPLSECCPSTFRGLKNVSDSPESLGRPHIAGPHHLSFWFCMSGVGPKICIFNKFQVLLV